MRPCGGETTGADGVVEGVGTEGDGVPSEGASVGATDSGADGADEVAPVVGAAVDATGLCGACDAGGAVGREIGRAHV